METMFVILVLALIAITFEIRFGCLFDERRILSQFCAGPCVDSNRPWLKRG